MGPQYQLRAKGPSSPSGNRQIRAQPKAASGWQDQPANRRFETSMVPSRAPQTAQPRSVGCHRRWRCLPAPAQPGSAVPAGPRPTCRNQALRESGKPSAGAVSQSLCSSEYLSRNFHFAFLTPRIYRPECPVLSLLYCGLRRRPARCGRLVSPGSCSAVIGLSRADQGCATRLCLTRRALRSRCGPWGSVRATLLRALPARSPGSE